MNTATKRAQELILMWVVVLCACATTGAVLYRFITGPANASKGTSESSAFLKDWKSQLAHGIQLGPRDAQVQLIEFADFECPYCASLQETLAAVRRRHPTSVSIIFMHFPLSGHRFALIAARVAECANEQGRFEAMSDQLFKGQEKFGLQPWDDYAIAAGVPNLPTFNSCIQSTQAIPRIAEGTKLGNQLNIKGTPTLIINGWQLDRPPDVDKLELMIKAAMAGKQPV